MTDDQVTERAEAQAQRALRALHAGRLADGARLYRRALEGSGGDSVPFKRHLRLLEGSGLTGAADVVRRVALHAGCDFSSGTLARGGDPREAAAEYEALFARGIANARMVGHYMVALSRIGDSATLAAVSAPDLLYRAVPLPIDGDRHAFLARAADALRASERREFHESFRSIRHHERVLHAQELAHPDLRALHEAVRGLIERYMTDVAASSHAFAASMKHPFTLQSWGTIMAGGGGHNIPHRHEGCWVIAVAYVAGEPGAGEAGTLQVGPDPEGDAACAGWPRAVAQPAPGTVVIMPAFYTHWTVPVAGGGPRISIALNAAYAGDY